MCFWVIIHPYSHLSPNPLSLALAQERYAPLTKARSVATAHTVLLRASHGVLITEPSSTLSHINHSFSTTFSILLQTRQLLPRVVNRVRKDFVAAGTRPNTATSIPNNLFDLQQNAFRGEDLVTRFLPPRTPASLLKRLPQKNDVSPFHHLRSNPRDPPCGPSAQGRGTASVQP